MNHTKMIHIVEGILARTLAGLHEGALLGLD